MALELFSYENLDRISDSFNPAIGIVAIGVATMPLLTKQWRAAGLRCAALLSGLLVTYGLMFLDKRLGIWSTVGLDYSTHTAFALVVTGFLALTLRKLRLLWAGLFVGYIALMLYQRYHSFYDIVTSAAVVLLLAGPIYWLLLLRHRVSLQKTR